MSLTQQLSCARSSRGSGERRIVSGRCAGAPSSTIASCSRHFVRRTSRTCSTTSARRASGSTRSWFDPHHEFRFPLLGAIEARGGIVLELRQAIEPWHVLGEENSGGRHVALRRFVGRARRGQRPRHDRRAPRGRVQRARACRCTRPARAASAWPACVTARGARRPRFIRRSACTRRWSSTSSTPGTSARSPGARYHVRHPGGRARETFPLNGYEAQSRRARGSTPSVTRRGGIRRRPWSTIPSSRSLSTSGGERPGHTRPGPRQRLSTSIDESSSVALALRRRRELQREATTRSSTPRAPCGRAGSRWSRGSEPWASRSSGVGGTRRAGSYTSTASATTSMAITTAPSAPGTCRRSPSSSARRPGSPWPRASRSARGCSIAFSRTSTDPSASSRRASCRRRSCSVTAGSCARARASCPRGALPAAVLGRRRAGHRWTLRRPGASHPGAVGRRAMPSRTGSCSRGRCPRRFATAAWSASRRSFARTRDAPPASSRRAGERTRSSFF